mgnify:CR=1 FL=1
MSDEMIAGEAEMELPAYLRYVGDEHVYILITEDLTVVELRVRADSRGRVTRNLAIRPAACNAGARYEGEYDSTKEEFEKELTALAAAVGSIQETPCPN